MKSAVAPVLLSVYQCPGGVMVKMIVTVEKMKKTVVRRSVFSDLSQKPFSTKGWAGDANLSVKMVVTLTCFSVTSLSAQLLVLPNCL